MRAIWYKTSFKLDNYCDVIMGVMASQITSLTIVYSIVYSDPDQRKHQSCASLAFVRGIHRGPVYSPHKWPATWKIFPFDDVIMSIAALVGYWCDDCETCERHIMMHERQLKYRQISNIKLTQYQNLNVSRLVLRLALRNLLKPAVQSRMKM